MWTFDQLQAYVLYVKSRFQPHLTPPAERVLSLYYQKQRAADSRNAGKNSYVSACVCALCQRFQPHSPPLGKRAPVFVIVCAPVRICL